MKRYFIIAFVSGWLGSVWAGINAHIEPSRVQLGSTFRLIFTLDNPQSDQIPNLKPLQQDFAIIGTERSMAYSIINGQTQMRGQWLVMLSPKRVGKLLIPPIQFGQEQSNSIPIEVLEAASATPAEAIIPPQDDLWLTAEVDNKNPFLNQQVIYTLKLYNRQHLMDAEFTPPAVNDALMISLGEGRRYQTEMQGKTYAVEEVQYAIFPQKSGTINITPPHFNAVIYDRLPHRVHLVGKKQQLKVQSILPTPNNASWLPAKQIKLTESFEPPIANMKEGSTLVRTITLQGVGVPAQLLPTLDFAANSTFSVYPEKPDIQNKVTNQNVVGTSRVKATYLLNKPGKIIIPALNVSWFNTTTGKQELASLPKQVIEVTPMAADSKKANANSQNPPIEVPELTSPVMTKETPTIKEYLLSSVGWWVAAVLGIVWVLTLGVWWLRGNGSNRHLRKRIRHELHTACMKNKPAQVRSALIEWGKINWPDADILNLQDILRIIHAPALKKEIQNLSETLYSGDKKTNWRGDKLWKTIAHYRPEKESKAYYRNDLPPINPC